MGTMRTSKSGLFLMEMILVISLFALSAAICLQMFAYANQTARASEELSYATLAARSGAECYQGLGGDLSEMAQILGGSVTGETLEVHYDDQWCATSQSVSYTLTLVKEDGSGRITVTAVEAGTTLYTLTVKCIGGDVV